MNLFRTGGSLRAGVFALVFSVLPLSCALKAQKTEAFAVYHLPGLNAVVRLPEELLVITRDAVNGAGVFEANDIDVAALQSGFVKAGIYLNAMPEDFLYEYVISSYRTGESAGIVDFASGEGFAGAEEIAEQFRLSGLAVSAGPVVTINGRVYYAFDFRREDLVYARQFFTVVNGAAVNIVYNKYGEELNAEDTEKTEAVLRGIVFENPREGQEDQERNS